MAAVIPWPFLANHDASNVPSHITSQPSRTFANVVRKSASVENTCTFPISQLPVPCVKGDTVSVSLPEEEYLAGLADCKTCLHARLLLPKGVHPLRYSELR